MFLSSKNENGKEISLIHGNFIVIEEMGILLTGPPNCGKSTLTLALIDRGHRFVCDDVVEVVKVDQALIGKTNHTLKHQLAIRGAGIFDIAKLFGSKAIMREHRLDLMVALKLNTDTPIPTQLNPDISTKTINNTLIPEIQLIFENINLLTSILELIVKNFKLSLVGKSNKFVI